MTRGEVAGNGVNSNRPPSLQLQLLWAPRQVSAARVESATAGIRSTWTDFGVIRPSFAHTAPGFISQHVPAAGLLQVHSELSVGLTDLPRESSKGGSHSCSLPWHRQLPPKYQPLTGHCTTPTSEGSRSVWEEICPRSHKAVVILTWG